jgi:hypothetical protein
MAKIAELNLEQKLQTLSSTFRSFCSLPTQSGGDLTTHANNYLRAVTQLFALDRPQLDAIVVELLQELQLEADMSDERRTSEACIAEFTDRLIAGIEKVNEELFPAFESSQLALAQDESIDNRQQAGVLHSKLLLLA